MPTTPTDQTWFNRLLRREVKPTVRLALNLLLKLRSLWQVHLDRLLARLLLPGPPAPKDSREPQGSHLARYRRCKTRPPGPMSP